jgi:acetyl esterase/lipase
VSLPERHQYGTARCQFGELFTPAGDGPWPVAVVLHGGFWKAQYGRRLMRPLCTDLAGRGWAAFNVEYRRIGRLSGGGFPRTLDDVAAAVDHLARLPAHGRVVLDLARVVAIGHSAGGQLAAWLATREHARVRVSGVVSQAGVLDLRLGSELELSRGAVERFVGGPPAALPDRYRAASPAERLPLGVPLLLTHGGRDEVVPPLITHRFAAAAHAAGDQVDVVIEPREDHFGHLEPGNALWRAVTSWLQ